MGREARAREAARKAATDPPIQPYADSVTWFESGPAPILNDLDLATLAVRVGMASNALNAQFRAAVAIIEQPSEGVLRMRDSLFSLVTTAALTDEAIMMAKSQMANLRRLAARAGAKPELLERIGRLCAGHHPASAFLDRARNELGFHWDKEPIKKSVREYGKNQGLVWLEWDGQHQPVHRLAAEVLAHALFPDAAMSSTEVAAKTATSATLANMGSAIDLIVEFFTAAVYGFMKSAGVVRKGAEE